MNVIPFRDPGRAASRRPPRLPLRPPGVFEYLASPAGAFDPVEDRLRMQQNLGALIAVLVIVVLGGWLIDRLSTYSRTLACLESGHRHCILLDIEQPRRW